MSAVSMMTTSGAACGDHKAGLARGSASGAVGKAQAPPPGQTLLLRSSSGRIGGDTRLRLGMIAAVCRIALQEFLREIRIVMLSVLICGLVRPPGRSPGHKTPARHRRKGQASSLCLR